MGEKKGEKGNSRKPDWAAGEAKPALLIYGNAVYHRDGTTHVKRGYD